MYLNQSQNLSNFANMTVNYNNILLLLYILCTLQLQPYHNPMASKPSPSTSTFIEGQSTKPQVPHGNPDVATTSAHSYAVPKYVTDVATLISASAESRKNVPDRSNQSLS